MKDFMKKDGARSVLASLLSILIGLLAGALIILIVGLIDSRISLTSAWEGIRLVLFGVFSTGRNAAGALTFGFNPANFGNMLFRATPLIMTGLSVAVAYKTGLFNIGAAGQYLRHAVHRPQRPLQRRPGMDHLDPGVFGRHAGWCGLGRDPRPSEGAAQHQRGHCLHHDQLDRGKPGDLAV